MDNPRNGNLGKQTDFTLRVSFDVKVHFDRPVGGEGPVAGIKTRLRDATEVVERVVSRILMENQGNLSSRVKLDLDEGFPRLQILPHDPKWLEFRGRIFDRMTFLGCGDYSLREEGILFSRLWDALITLGGLQQGGAMGIEDEEWSQHVEDVAADLYMALTGREPNGPRRSDQVVEDVARTGEEDAGGVRG
jgi:hypothetical protein